MRIGAASNETRFKQSHRTTRTPRRACCIVESKASVDSVPWFWFAPDLCRPSKPPPVPGSHMRTEPSLSPRNQSRAVVIPSAHRPWPSTSNAAGTRISKSCHLNGLLVESGASVLGTASSHRSDREMSVSSFTSQQPIQQLQPAPQKGRAIEGYARRDHGFGENRVCVSKARSGQGQPG